jgi:hypothetical protein
VPIYPTIAEALMRGTSKLAVDGVVIIGEHGRYPKNERGQTLYPRYKFFKEVVKVFEASGRSVPVFSDKHLSTEAELAAMDAKAEKTIEDNLRAFENEKVYLVERWKAKNAGKVCSM